MSDKNNCFKEAVCIEVQRIFDSCSDRDCIYELPVTLCEDSAEITDDMNIVKPRCIEVDTVCISVDAVPFKSGYYSVDITYRFKVTAEAYAKTFCQPTMGTLLCGTALWNKRVILYGGEGNAKVFSSDQDFVFPTEEDCCSCEKGSNSTTSMPKATIQIVDPVALEAKLICVPCTTDPNPGPQNCCCPNPCNKPGLERTLAISVGLFSIVQLSRPVSMIVPAYDYCIPCKDCSSSASSEAPCEIFDRIEFPTDQFFPRPSGNDNCKCGCCDAGNNDDNNSCDCKSD